MSVFLCPPPLSPCFQKPWEGRLLFDDRSSEIEKLRGNHIFSVVEFFGGRMELNAVWLETSCLILCSWNLASVSQQRQPDKDNHKKTAAQRQPWRRKLLTELATKILLKKRVKHIIWGLPWYAHSASDTMSLVSV